MRPGFDVQFMWPDLLWLLTLLPLCLLGYATVRRGIRPSLANIVTLALIAVGLTSLLLATARPQLQLSLPTRAERLMVVLDISGSMRADDVKPDRFTVAKNTLEQLISQQPAAMQVGLVTTAATATLIEAPTTDRESLLQALKTINLQTGSALGSGLLIGLSELLPSAGINVQALMNDSMRGSDPNAKKSWQPDPALIKAPGSNRSVAMVLISDGESNMGPKVMEVAELAEKFGVRIYTIGVGTTAGAVVKANGISQRVRLESATLADIAKTTLGTYYEGTSAKDLDQIFQAIQASIVFDRRQTVEASAWLLMLGLMFVTFGMGISLVRQGRLI